MGSDARRRRGRLVLPQKRGLGGPAEPQSQVGRQLDWAAGGVPRLDQGLPISPVQLASVLDNRTQLNLRFRSPVQRQSLQRHHHVEPAPASLYCTHPPASQLPPTDQLSVPAQQCLRADQEGSPGRTRWHAAEGA